MLNAYLNSSGTLNIFAHVKQGRELIIMIVSPQFIAKKVNTMLV